MGPISQLSCIYIDTPNLEASVDFYTRCFGLDVQATQSGAVALCGSIASSRQLVLRSAGRAALAGLEFQVESEQQLGAFARKLATLDVPFIGDQLPFASGAAMVALDPNQTPIRVRVADQTLGASVSGEGDRPGYLSHVVVNSPSPGDMTKFYQEGLGFEVADAYERELLTFLRCHQPQHHCLGISPGGRAGLNHFAMDCGSIDAVMKSVGRMRRTGHEPVWGPGRHGPGGNVFCYYADPVGLVAEFTCNLIQITDESRWAPRIWARTPENGNVWGTGGPSQRAIELMNDGPAAPADVP